MSPVTRLAVPSKFGLYYGTSYSVVSFSWVPHCRPPCVSSALGGVPLPVWAKSSENLSR